jgi:predicted amidohydrolase YtcJ
MHTIDAAYALGMEDRIGSLKPGKLADVVVLDRDIEAAPLDRLHEGAAWITVLDGEIAYDARTAA